jgi:hypothetical protein
VPLPAFRRSWSVFEGDLKAGSAARILSAMAKALINDLEIGLNRNR